MTAHTRTDIEATVEYECALGDCGHDERPCPTGMYDCCEECSTRNWEESEGGVVMWEECGGTGAYFAEQDLEDECLDEFDWPPESTAQDHTNRSEGIDR